MFVLKQVVQTIVKSEIVVEMTREEVIAALQSYTASKLPDNLTDEQLMQMTLMLLNNEATHLTDHSGCIEKILQREIATQKVTGELV